MKRLACLLALLIAGPAMAANDVAGLLDSPWQGLSRYEAQAPQAEFVGINRPAAGS